MNHFRPLDTAPRDGTMIRVLVDFEEHSTEDTDDLVWTMGAWMNDDLGGMDWQFVGWCWTHDHFTDGKGTVVGWLPLVPDAESDKNENGWEANVKHLLDNCPHTVRVREGGGPESLVESLVVTFMKMQNMLRQ